MALFLSGFSASIETLSRSSIYSSSALRRLAPGSNARLSRSACSWFITDPPRRLPARRLIEGQFRVKAFTPPIVAIDLPGDCAYRGVQERAEQRVKEFRFKYYGAVRRAVEWLWYGGAA